jgi:hypothetical protein
MLKKYQYKGLEGWYKKWDNKGYNNGINEV